MDAVADPGGATPGTSSFERATSVWRRRYDRRLARRSAGGSGWPGAGWTQVREGLRLLGWVIGSDAVGGIESGASVEWWSH